MAPVTSARGLAATDSWEGGEATENQTELLKHEWHHSRGTSARSADCVHNPGFTAATMRASPGAVSTMPAADLATSVAVDTATPIWAWRRAGASLAPSPHMPTVWPSFWKAFTKSYFPSGKMPAKTANVSGRKSGGRGPGGQTGPGRPTARATVAAVAGASPVTITVRTP